MQENIGECFQIHEICNLFLLRTIPNIWYHNYYKLHLTFNLNVIPLILGNKSDKSTSTQQTSEDVDVPGTGE